MSSAQCENIKECVNITSKRDFIVGAVWCTILEKFLISYYLYTVKTISYDQGLKLSEYILNNLSNSNLIK
jgi:hypothetical protein